MLCALFPIITGLADWLIDYSLVHRSAQQTLAAFRRPGMLFGKPADELCHTTTPSSGISLDLPILFTRALYYRTLSALFISTHSYIGTEEANCC